jgi:hypothetical protein
MSTPRPAGPLVPHWRELYEDAVLELDLAKIPKRIEDARKAIQEALVEFSVQGKTENCRGIVRRSDCPL